MIPEELRNFTKSDVTFFLEKIPLALKSELCYRNFLKLLNLYVEGVITQFELNELVQDLKCSSESDDVLAQLQVILSLRNSSRRVNNNLLKPLSEIDLTAFSAADHITPNYYRLSDSYPMPVCSGRFLNPISKSVLNDRYCSVNLVQSKFKHKNVHEDLLFKNEDDMYSFDYVILQLETVVNNLQKEAVNAALWDSQDPTTKLMPYKTKYLSRVTLAFIDKFYSEKTNMLNQSCVTEKIIQNPVMVIDAFLKRLTDNLEKVRFEKQLKFDEWR